MTNNTPNIKKYRKALGELYNYLTDEEVMELAVQIRAFLHPIINNYIQNNSDKGKILPNKSEING